MVVSEGVPGEGPNFWIWGAHRGRDPAWTVASERKNTRACRETQQQGTKALEATAPHFVTAAAVLSFLKWVFRGVFMR